MLDDPDFKKRTADHWSYIKGILEHDNISPELVEKIGWHYRMAMIHGYKHGKHDMFEEMERRFGKQTTHSK